MIGGAAFYFYDSLIALAQVSQHSEQISAELERVAANQTQLQKYWADNAPINFQHKVDLVAAEWQRVLGNKLEAIDLYDRAIAGAKENSYIQEEALANELAAKFYLDWGREKIAQVYRTHLVSLRTKYIAFRQPLIWQFNDLIRITGFCIPKRMKPRHLKGL